MFCRLALISLLSLFSLPARGDTSEAQATARAFDHIRGDPARLSAFMQAFPKGADLHNHLAGAVYAESYLKWAAEDGLCVSVPQGRILSSKCRPGMQGDVPAGALIGHPDARASLIDALSMRDFVPTEDDRSGHDHFFDTFGRFSTVYPAHEGEILAEALDRAAADHIVYVELMISPGLSDMVEEGARHPLKDDDFTAARNAMAPDLPRLVEIARKETDAMEQRAREVMQCDTPQSHPGCAVTARYLFQTMRIVAPSNVFSQLDAGYELVHSDPRFVGLNIVAPEDDLIAMRDYDLHMRMFHALNVIYPDVKLSLHAGELTPGLVPPEGLRNHIRAAISIAGARRIGHGVDIMWENDATALLHEMAQRKLMVEINLTSNDEILNIRGPGHPFSLYRRAGVPVALSTDDEGVSRGSLTQEYLRAATTWPLSYAELKALSRNGLIYAFIPGKSLWDGGDRMVNICRAPQSFACANFLRTSEKARLQLQLEQNFTAFENYVSHEELFQ